MIEQDDNLKSENRSLMGRLLLLAVGMFGFGFLLVPLYDVFCEITGLGGRTNTTAAVVEEAPDLSREIRVEFVTTVNSYAPFEFVADVDSMTVSPGKMYFATFTAKNLSGDDKVAQAVPSVAPVSAAEHFKKIECFCFESQDFMADEAERVRHWEMKLELTCGDSSCDANDAEDRYSCPEDCGSCP